MERELKRQRRTVGAVVKIPLEDGFYTYGRILEDKVAFYDIYTEEDKSIEEILESPVLFITAVYNSVITKGFWPKVSKAIPLEDELIETPPKFRQDPLNIDSYSIILGNYRHNVAA